MACWRPEANCDAGGDQKCCAQASEAPGPTEAIEQLADHRAANQAAQEIASQIEPTCSALSPEAARLTSPVATACAKNVPMAASAMPASVSGGLCARSNGRLSMATRVNPT